MTRLEQMVAYEKELRKHRQRQMVCEVIKPLIDQMIAEGVLPQPIEEVKVTWDQTPLPKGD